MNPVKVLILGAGDRGNAYAEYSSYRNFDMEVVGVAEPREIYRNRFSEKYRIPEKYIFNTWEEALTAKKFADAVIIATPDKLHYLPVIKALKQGYHVLVEKPLALNEKECLEILEEVKKSKKVSGISHVLRHTSYFSKIKELIDEGLIGEVVSIEHIEPVGYSYVESYVRGNWRNSKTSCPMILAKSSHDLDLLSWFVGKPFKKISSFGSLTHFKKENAPAGSSDRCINDCKVEENCPYSALKFYMDPKITGWPVDVITLDFSYEGIIKALKEGPYGRCVYHCDNDVVDHQVVCIEFEGGVTASFTMTAFAYSGHRRTRIMGTYGEMIGDTRYIDVTLFKDESKIVFDTLDKHEYNYTSYEHAGYGHSGGDQRMISNFINAVRKNDLCSFPSTIEGSVESHLMAFYAEESRLQNKVVLRK
jgi:predicted dehydrogenase